MSIKICLALVVVSGLALLPVYLTRTGHEQPAASLGTPIHDGAADREVVIHSNTKAVNVKRMETVRFIAISGEGNQHSFMWRFDGPHSGPAPMDLNRVAPAGVLSRPIKVYISSHYASTTKEH